MAYRKTSNEMYDALARQIGHLRRSCAAYDNGIEEEAERIASAIYVLCWDSGDRSKSALGANGYKDKMKFVTSTGACWDRHHPNRIHLLPRLVCITNGTKGRSHFRPLLDSNKPMHIEVGFNDWWNESVVHNGSGHRLSRKQLVFALRSQDGGSHIDPKLTDAAYVFLSREGGSWVSSGPERDGARAIAPLENGHWASMRQIGWELDQSLSLIGL